MCGISGVISAGSQSNAGMVAAMSDALLHRGPDGSGIFQGQHVSLAMRRLSIIDLGGGGQPLYSEDGAIVLIANGEIYNHVELRQDLERRGHQFRTHSDCEVILHLYEEFGAGCVDSLRGMFAFALWDSKCRKLLLGRDRMGEKPLYYWSDKERMIFCSELRGLLASRQIPFDLDPVAVCDYFHFNFVPEPGTILRGVRKLPAAHVMTVTLPDLAISQSCYWRPEDAPEIDDDPVRVIAEELDDVFKLVVRSDVPVGLALSGGVDSSAIALLAARHYPGKLQAFSVGYEGRPACDERRMAQSFAQEMGIGFHEIELSQSGMLDSFADVVHLRDDPICDISGYGYYSVMKASRLAGVPVMLQGHGADELFWGYAWVRDAARLAERKRHQKRKPSLLPFLVPELPGDLSAMEIRRWIKSGAGLRKGIVDFQALTAEGSDRVPFYDLSEEYQIALSKFRRLTESSYLKSLADYDPARHFSPRGSGHHSSVAVTKLICDTYLQQVGIAQGDRLGMASSVELRLPFVDHVLVEKVIGLRKVRHDHALEPKSWLKSALRGSLPDRILDRPKQGFAPPVRNWHRALINEFGQSLRQGELVQRGILSPAGARSLSGSSSPLFVSSHLSLRALVLETWCREMKKRIALP